MKCYVSVLACVLATPLSLTGQVDRPPPPNVSLTATTALETVGRICEPFHCQPNYTIAWCGESVRFGVSGTGGAPYALFAGTQADPCVPITHIPGIMGELALLQTEPIITIAFGVLSTDRPPISFPPPCGTMTVFIEQCMSTMVAPGTDVQFQAASFVGTTTGARLGLSRPVNIRNR